MSTAVTRPEMYRWLPETARGETRDVAICRHCGCPKTDHIFKREPTSFTETSTCPHCTDCPGFEEKLEVALPELVRQIPDRIVGTSKPKDRPREHHFRETTIVYTDEIKSHCNVLLRTQGQKAVDEYLKSLREGKTNQMSSFDMGEALLRQKEAASNIFNQAGPLTEMLERADKQVTELRNQADNIEEFANHLRNALNALNRKGRATKSSSASAANHGGPRYKGQAPVSWPAMLEALQKNEGIMEYSDLLTYAVKQTGLKRMQVYSQFATCERQGRVTREGDTVTLLTGSDSETE